MFSDRKPKFRSRKLEFNKTLPVYRCGEVDDADDFDGPLRSVAAVATGVDKEEEEVSTCQAKHLSPNVCT